MFGANVIHRPRARLQTFGFSDDEMLGHAGFKPVLRVADGKIIAVSHELHHHRILGRDELDDNVGLELANQATNSGSGTFRPTVPHCAILQVATTGRSVPTQFSRDRRWTSAEPLGIAPPGGDPRVQSRFGERD